MSSSASAENAFDSWHVLGAGAIGGLWALRLAGRGVAVTLLGRNGDRQRTLTLQDGERVLRHTFPQRDSRDPGSVHALLVCTKAPASEAALMPLLPSLPAHTPVVLLQNGMGVDEWLCTQRADLCVLTAITTDGVWRRDRDTLVQAGHGDTFLGAARAQDDAVAKAVAQTLGMTFAPDIRARRWRKLAVNCAINPLTVRYRCRNGELLENPQALAAMREVCAEVAAVMRAEGMDADAEQLFQQACATAEQTAANLSSMYADAEAGRDTEIRFLNGYVVSKAEQHGLAAPANTALLQEILALR